MLKRKIYDKLLKWKNESNGKSAILIDGARRTGKSYIVKTFAENEYKSHIIIDFGNVDKEVIRTFEDDIRDLDLFFTKLSFYFNTLLYPRESVIVFDEVQQYPYARQMIKYLVEDGRFDYIETGSLIRLKKNTKDIIIPSEEEHLELHPFDFEEFLWAMGDEVTIPLIKKHFELKKPLGDAMHRKVMNSFRQYMLVGGMPQAILAYIDNKNFESCDKAKKKILNLYKEDVSKFASGYEEKVYEVIENVPAQLAQHEKKYMLHQIDKNARFRSYEDSFIWLKEAMIVNLCYNSTDPNIGLALSSENNTLKCYMADTGLLITMGFMDKSVMENELYKAILFDKLYINEGMIMENIVAQMLRANGHKLYFYSRIEEEKNEESNKLKKKKYEIDFLIRQDSKIIPVEVKSNRYKEHTSIDKFKEKFKKKIGTPYILYTKDLMYKDGIYHLPIYMAIFL